MQQFLAVNRGHGHYRGLFLSNIRSVDMWGRLAVIWVLAFSILAGCSSGGNGKELMETAQFEEKQGNREHATKLYQEIVQKHPGSENAKKAEARMAELVKGK
jgi:outer membrane protein assembly factor BamD (BamD/ComL family)